MTPLLARKFIIVSGKGGVGRTTVAATLAQIAAARRGKRVLIATATAADRVGRLFGRGTPIGTEIVTVAPQVDAVNITPESSIREYGRMVLRSEVFARALFDNRATRGFLGAVPGLDAYAVLGKTWWHTTETVDGRPRYDLVIFDAPASGHAALMLRIPQAILTAMPKGPLARDADAIRDLLSDPVRAALLIVTLAEELPAREAAELAAQARGELGLPLGPLVVNAVPTEALSSPSVDEVMARIPATGDDDALARTLRVAAGVRAHRRMADQALATLARDPGLPIISLPRVPTAELGPDLLAALVPPLAAALGV